MNGFSCIYGYYKDKNTFVLPANNACWGNIMTQKPYEDYIYIDNYDLQKTRGYIKMLTEVINEIRECKIVKIDDKEYIKYKLIHNYGKDLTLLNFIRYLWNCPAGGFKSKFTIAFFETLRKLNRAKNIDAIQRLYVSNYVATIASMNMTNGTLIAFFGDHSNTINPKNAKLEITNAEFISSTKVGSQNLLSK